MENSRGRSQKVLVLYTGGTMGMLENEHGSLEPVKGYLTQRLNAMSELQEQHMPQVEVEEFDTLIDSADITPSDWKHIVRRISDNYYNYDGFVVIMGTDTLAYTASALSFMLENLGKPVIITGSMIPFYKGYSDGRRNLLVSIILAVVTYIPEVCVYFNNKLLRGCRTKKVNTSSLDAFMSPDYPPLAKVGTSIVINDKYIQPPPRLPFKAHFVMDANIVCLRMIPGFQDAALMELVTHNTNLNGLVLELYGTGNAPSKRASLIDCLKIARDKGVVIAITSQCLHGPINLSEYVVGKQLLDIGVVPTFDMTVEAVATKLGFLFGMKLSPEDVEAEMKNNLRGEITCHIKEKNSMFSISHL